MGEAVLEDGFDGVGVAGASDGGGELEPAKGFVGEAPGHLAEELDDAFAFAGAAVEGGEPDEGAFGVGMEAEEILDGAEGVRGAALEDQGGSQAQHDALVAGIEFGGLAIGLVGLGIFVGEFVVDAQRVERMGPGRSVAVRRQDVGRRNKPSVQQGRRARQRAATGRDAEKDEAERKPPLEKAAHGAPANGRKSPYFFL